MQEAASAGAHRPLWIKRPPAFTERQGCLGRRSAAARSREGTPHPSGQQRAARCASAVKGERNHRERLRPPRKAVRAPGRAAALFVRALVLGRARPQPQAQPQRSTGEPPAASTAHPHSRSTGGCEGREGKGTAGRLFPPGARPGRPGRQKAASEGRPASSAPGPRPAPAGGGPTPTAGSAAATVGVLRPVSAAGLFCRLPVGPLTVPLPAERVRGGGRAYVRLSRVSAAGSRRSALVFRRAFSSGTARGS